MRLRLVSIDELQFLTCLRHQLWGSKSARFAEWKRGDYLAFIVDKAIAGLAEVAGDPLVSREKVWDNGLFPYRIPLKMVHATERGKRSPILGPIRDALMSAWTTNYGWGIRNQQLLQGDPADTIASLIQAQPNSLAAIRSGLESLVEEASAARDAKAAHKRRPRRPRKTKVQPQRLDIGPQEEDESEHIKAQANLIRLGRITGCSVWIASNDRSRQYRGKDLGEACLRSLPNLGLSAEATKRISYIDVIWIRQNAPVCAFEIETTTSIYSGLLRMSDLLAVVPALNIQLYVVAPRSRQSKVIAELARPTFQRIGLNEYCRFIAVEDLHALLERIKDLPGYVLPSVLDTIAAEPEPALESEMQ